MIKKLIYNNITKSILNVVLATLSGVFIGRVVNNASKFNLAITIVLSVVTIILNIIWCTEKNPRLNLSVEQYKKVLNGISDLCKLSAMNINKQLHKIINDSVFDEKIYDFPQACSLICERIYIEVIEPMLSTTEKELSKVEISYIEVNESDKGKEYRFSGYYAKDDFTTLNREGYEFKPINRPIYYDEKLIYNNTKEIKVLANKREIQKNFFKKKEHVLDYEQYIAVPVVCHSENNTHKVIGLLEITLHKGLELKMNREEIKEFTKRIIKPYTNLLLMTYKSIKAMKAVPDVLTIKTKTE